MTVAVSAAVEEAYDRLLQPERDLATIATYEHREAAKAERIEVEAAQARDVFDRTAPVLESKYEELLTAMSNFVAVASGIPVLRAELEAAHARLRKVGEAEPLPRKLGIRMATDNSVRIAVESFRALVRSDL